MVNGGGPVGLGARAGGYAYGERGAVKGFAPGCEERRSKQRRGAKGRSKARGQGSPGHAGARCRSQPEAPCKGTPVLREEKLWAPWNGLIVIGKRVKLLGRNTRKPRMWDPKAEPGSWRPETMRKKVFKEKSEPTVFRDRSEPTVFKETSEPTVFRETSEPTVFRETSELTVFRETSEPSQEGMDVRMLHSVGSGVGKDSPGEFEETQEVGERPGAGSSAEVVAESGRQSTSEESLGSAGLKEEADRSQGRLEEDEEVPHNVASPLQVASEGVEEDSPGETEGKPESAEALVAESGVDMAAEFRLESVSEEKLESAEEAKVGTSGEDVRSRGYQVAQNEEPRWGGEKRRPPGDKRWAIGQKPVFRGERRGSVMEKSVFRGERRGSVMEKPVFRAERRGSVMEKPVFRAERRGSVMEKPVFRRERRGSVLEKQVHRGEKKKSSGERSRFTREKRRPSGENLSPGDKPGSSAEDLGSSGEKLEERSRIENVSEESLQRLQEITDDERVVEITGEEMEIPFESVEEREEQLQGTEEGEKVDQDDLREVKDIGESVSMEKDIHEDSSE